MYLQVKRDGLKTDGSFTMANSNLFFEENKYLRIFFLFYHEIVCCVYSLESHHRGDLSEYTPHTIIM